MIQVSKLEVRNLTCFCKMFVVFQYENLIQQFISVHKQYDAISSHAGDIVELKNEIGSMEDEKEQLIKRIQRLKKKVSNGRIDKIF
jgi:archaellum component FlaC